VNNSFLMGINSKADLATAEKMVSGLTPS